MADSDLMLARSSGIFGLFHCDGKPIDDVSARFLGISLPKDRTSWIVQGFDGQAPHAVSRHDSATSTTVLVGELEGANDLALRLGLPSGAPAAQIASEALERFGSNTPIELVGEWSLLNWRHSGNLTLMLSAAHRDRIFFASSGRRIAVAPNLSAFTQIGWVSADIDEAGLLFQLGRADIRSAQGGRTLLKAVQRLEPGESITFEAGTQGIRKRTQVFLPQRRWKGTFKDAVAESEALLRQIMSTRVARSGRVGPLLSGGLDSSVLTWLVAEQSQKGLSPLCITSSAPNWSELSDETGFAEIVARHLGLNNCHVFPAQEANTYRPPNHILSGASGPILSNRHCLTEAFQIKAREEGLSLLINGTYGEMSVTADFPEVTIRHKLQGFAAHIRRAIAGAGQAYIASNSFHVRLARHRLDALPEPVRAAIARPPVAGISSPNDGLLGYVDGVEKALAHPNEFYAGALRMDFPFRDMRLLRLFASFPLKTIFEGGRDRPIVRQMLCGKVPELIRLRRQGMPASPDHFARLKHQAADARRRIPAFREKDIDDWLDLDWLDQALARVSEHGARDYVDANEVQLTALAAEFLYWWRART